jgi:uncharacterized membrane protein
MKDISARLEELIGLVLRVGVTASTICLALGLLLSLVGRGGISSALLNIGVIVLLVTPVARVVVSVAEYAIAQDWLFLALTVTVLLELLGSVVAAMAGRRL